MMRFLLRIIAFDGQNAGSMNHHHYEIDTIRQDTAIGVRRNMKILSNYAVAVI